LLKVFSKAKIEKREPYQDISFEFIYLYLTDELFRVLKL